MRAGQHIHQDYVETAHSANYAAAFATSMGHHYHKLTIQWTSEQKTFQHLYPATPALLHRARAAIFLCCCNLLNLIQAQNHVIQGQLLIITIHDTLKDIHKTLKSTRSSSVLTYTLCTLSTLCTRDILTCTTNAMMVVSVMLWHTCINIPSEHCDHRAFNNGGTIHHTVPQ